MQTVLYTFSFFVICLAAHRIGQFFTRIRLPYITGYLFAGALVGSFGLNWLPSSAAESLRFIDEMALAIIAFVAGSELYLKELRSRLQRIVWTTAGILVAAFVLLGTALYLFAGMIPFMADWPAAQRLSVALLGGTVLLALSPPSTIAVIKEVRARGPFTQTALSVTVLMDVVIIVLFAVITSLAGALLLDVPFSAGFVGVLALDLALALALGYGVGQLLQVLLRQGWPAMVKIALIVVIGYGIFALAGHVKALSAAHLPFEVYIEPLLIALVGGFWITNFTPFRQQFDGLLHDLGPVVYVAFFTLTGLSLKLDLLWATLPIALALFVVRMGGIFIGSYLGGWIGGAPPQARQLSWMAFITQAGIALGLAREVAVQFPSLGDAFATLIISVVVLNEVFGPLFLKAALKRAGEAHEPATATPDAIRDVLLLGIEGQSVAVARSLQAQGWQVIMADTDAKQIARFADSELLMHEIDDTRPETLQGLVKRPLDALVAMLPDEEANYEACQWAYETYSLDRIVTRLSNGGKTERFRALGAVVVDAATAMISLLDQAVRAPQSAATLLHRDPTREVVQITISNPDMDSVLVRDLRLPADVLLLDILRRGSRIVPHGYSRIYQHDEITLLGSPESLDLVTLRLGY